MLSFEMLKDKKDKGTIVIGHIGCTNNSTLFYMNAIGLLLLKGIAVGNPCGCYIVDCLGATGLSLRDNKIIKGNICFQLDVTDVTRFFFFKK